MNSNDDKQKYTLTCDEQDSRLLNDWKTHIQAENFTDNMHKKIKIMKKSCICKRFK